MHFDGKVNVTASWFEICMRLTQKIHEFNLSRGWHEEIRGCGKRKMRPGSNASQTKGGRGEWLWQVADRAAREITSIVELSAEVAHRVQHVAYDTRHCCFLSTYQCVCVFLPPLSTCSFTSCSARCYCGFSLRLLSSSLQLQLKLHSNNFICILLTAHCRRQLHSQQQQQQLVQPLRCCK